MDAKTYGGYTVEALREFIAHSEKNGESIDAITGDDAASASVICDLLDALLSDAAQAPQKSVATVRVTYSGYGMELSTHVPYALPEGMHELYASPAIPQAAGDAGQAPFDMLAHLKRQREFSERTFGPGARTKGVADHIRKELIEIEAKPSDLTEWIDVVILALDGAWRAGGSPQQIIDALCAKQTKNEGRTWPDWRTADPNKAIEHDRSRDGCPQCGGKGSVEFRDPEEAWDVSFGTCNGSGNAAPVAPAAAAPSDAFVRSVQNLTFLCRTESKRLDDETLKTLTEVEDHLVAQRFSTRNADGELSTTDSGLSPAAAQPDERAAFDAMEHQVLIGYDKNGDAVFGTDPIARSNATTPKTTGPIYQIGANAGGGIAWWDVDKDRYEREKKAGYMKTGIVYREGE